MTPLEFLKKHLGEIAVLFPHVKIRYAYDSSIDMHVVELTPQHEFYGNEKLDAAWIPVSLTFKQRFEEEDICFVSSDSTLSVQQAELEWNGEVAALDSAFYYAYNEVISELSKAALFTEFPVAMEQEFLLPVFSWRINSEFTNISTVYNSTKLNLSEKLFTTSQQEELLDTVNEYSAAA